MRVVLMGSPAFAVPSLQALHEAGHDIVAVYSQPPRPAGRGRQLQPTAVHAAAQALGLPVHTPEKLNDAALADVLALEADVFVVVGYGLLLPKVLVESRLCINVHPSALPRWRGATPVQSAIWAGDTTTDVCLMRLEAGMDTGPVFVRVPVAIAPDMTSGDLNAIVWRIGAEALVKLLPSLPQCVPVPQVGEATRALKITPAMRALDWRQTSAQVHNHVRALSPLPGPTATLAGEVLKVGQSSIVDGAGPVGTLLALEATGMVVACGSGAVRLGWLQRPGGKPLAPLDVARGWPALQVGAQFAVPPEALDA
jgi:methionyl-tRNA formyltransferase